MDIQIIEKPDWVSWDEIKQCLMNAHAENRSKGIVMRKPSLPASEIEKEIGDAGIMLVALDGPKVVGTAALLIKEKNTWYNIGICGYLCFAAILPAYNGKGIYKRLCEKREEIAKKKGIDRLFFDTHHKNQHVISINKSQGFKCVDVKMLRDHWNVVMFKWLNGCPYSDTRCWVEFSGRKIYKIIRKTTKAFLFKISCRK